MRRKIIATGVLALGLGGGAQAQDGADATVLDTIMVTTPNRTPTEASRTGSRVERVTQQQIEEKSLSTVGEYLHRLPGVSVAATGGLGQQTNIFVRGLPGRYVKTLYNGIDVSDPANTQVQTHYEYLLTGGVSAIEVLKGSQSTLYGSNAIAGVVDISTFGAAEQGVHHTVEFEGGSFGTVRGRYGLVAAKDGSRIAANATGFRTDGISAAAGFPEKDGYDNITLDVNVEHRINEAFSVFGSAIHVDAKADFDGWGADSLVNRNITDMTGGRAGFNLDLMDGRLKNTFSVQGFRMNREVEGDFPSSFIGRRHKFDYQGSFDVAERIVLQYGADHERQTAETASASSAMDESHDLTGLWTQAVVEPIDNFVLTAGLRHDEHSEFGGHTTYRGTASYLFDASGTRLHSSFGTGFRAPSLFELYDPSSGNADLKPETSKSFDIGVEQGFLDGRLTAGITYFWLEVDDRIDWVMTDPDWFTGTYQQVEGQSRSQGVEASFFYAATDWLDLAGSYTYTDSKQPFGVRASRVPRHMVTLAASVRPAEKWTASADVKFVADTVESGSALDDYVLLNARVAYQVTESTQIYLRGENLLNQKYQVARGYGTPGIAAYAGIRAKF